MAKSQGIKIEYEGRAINQATMSAIVNKNEEKERLLPDYAKVSDFANARISRSQLNKWKKADEVRTVKYKGTLYFHREDVLRRLREN
ncbi:hypothetical protein JYU04_00020 [Dehalococcoides mccartyi]|nr:hypothetical protein [Dehalococcoides mccartyi]